MSKIKEEIIDGILRDREMMIAEGEWLEADWRRKQMLNDVLVGEHYEKGKKALYIPAQRYEQPLNDNPSEKDFAGQF